MFVRTWKLSSDIHKCSWSIFAKQLYSPCFNFVSRVTVLILIDQKTYHSTLILRIHTTNIIKAALLYAMCQQRSQHFTPYPSQVYLLLFSPAFTHNQFPFNASLILTPILLIVAWNVYDLQVHSTSPIPLSVPVLPHSFHPCWFLFATTIFNKPSYEIISYFVSFFRTVSSAP